LAKIIHTKQTQTQEKFIERSVTMNYASTT